MSETEQYSVGGDKTTIKVLGIAVLIVVTAIIIYVLATKAPFEVQDAEFRKLLKMELMKKRRLTSEQADKEIDDLIAAYNAKA